MKWKQRKKRESNSVDLQYMWISYSLFDFFLHLLLVMALVSTVYIEGVHVECVSRWRRMNRRVELCASLDTNGKQDFQKKTIHSKSCASNYTEVFQINVDYKITNNLARHLWTIIFVKCKQIHSTILILNFQKYNWPKYSFVSWQPYIGCRHLNLQSICSCTNKFAYFFKCFWNSFVLDLRKSQPIYVYILQFWAN